MEIGLPQALRNIPTSELVADLRECGIPVQVVSPDSPVNPRACQITAEGNCVLNVVFPTQEDMR